MSYYLIEQNIEKDDIYISWEYDGSIENIIKGEGKNEIDFLNKNVISIKTKNFLSSLNIDYISFLPYTFYDLQNNERKIEAFIMDVEKEVDCIDYEESELVVFGGEIRGVDKLVFKNY
ncbi:MAG: hypothetical protein HRT69_03590 [Flavobacteriaceae bacterium]|nr:hypothetical protein [Flavobacteriaceae bacterium]